jgi:hypothetical protein
MIDPSYEVNEPCIYMNHLNECMLYPHDGGEPIWYGADSGTCTAHDSSSSDPKQVCTLYTNVQLNDMY